MNNISTQTNISNSDIYIDFHDINSRLDNLEIKIQQLIQISSDNHKSSQKLNDHIDFVEHTYDTLKTPLNYITHKINNFISTDNTSMQFIA